VIVKNPSSLIKLSQARGVFLACLVENYQHKIYEYSPNLIKSAAVGHGHADKEGIKKATSIEFSSVLFANEKLQLSSIKAVSDNYPLKSSLLISDAPYAKSRSLNQRPPGGTVWIEPRIYGVLSLKKGQQLELGYTDLKVDGVIMRQPGQGSTLFSGYGGPLVRHCSTMFRVHHSLLPAISREHLGLLRCPQIDLQLVQFRYTKNPKFNL